MFLGFISLSHCNESNNFTRAEDDTSAPKFATQSSIMKFTIIAIGTLIHSQSTFVGHVDAFSTPKLRSKLLATTGVDMDEKLTVLSGSGGLPGGFDMNHDSVTDEELKTFQGSIVHSHADR